MSLLYESWHRTGDEFSTEVSDLKGHYGQADPKCPACKKTFKLSSLHKVYDKTPDRELTHWSGVCPEPCGAKLTIFND